MWKVVKIELPKLSVRNKQMVSTNVNIFLNRYLKTGKSRVRIKPNFWVLYGTVAPITGLLIKARPHPKFINVEMSTIWPRVCARFAKLRDNFTCFQCGVSLKWSLNVGATQDVVLSCFNGGFDGQQCCNIKPDELHL